MKADDIGKVLEAMSPSYNQDTTEKLVRLHIMPYLVLNPYEFDISPAIPTKRVTLYLSTGTSFSPYQATAPSSFSLNIQATIYPSKYESNVLKATTP